MKRIKSTLRRIATMSRATQLSIIGGAVAGVVVVGVVVSIPLSPNGNSVIGSVVDAAGKAVNAVTGATPVPTDGSDGGQNSDSDTRDPRRDGNGRDQNGARVCDQRSRTTDAATREACTKGYVAPEVAFGSVKCTPTDVAGAFTVVVKWKTIGGHFTTAHIYSRDKSGRMTEKWTITDPTPETVIIDKRRVNVAFDSMNGMEGVIDTVLSPESPTIRAGEVCGIAVPTPAPTDESNN